MSTGFSCACLVMLQAGWSREQLRHVIAARLRAAQAYPPPATMTSPHHEPRPPTQPAAERTAAPRSPTAAAARTRSMPGSPRIVDEHFPDAPRGERTPKPTNPSETQFLAIGPGAAAWLVEAAATGVRRIRAKMADAVALAKLYGTADVDRALGTAATVGGFAEGDLLSILDHQDEHDHAEPIRRIETHSLQPGTSAWSGFGSA